MKPITGPVLTAAQMRVAESECGVAPPELMRRAGNALAEAVLRFGGGRETLVLCGPGNNGGDGYLVATRLRAQGIAVRVAAAGAPATDLCRTAADAWAGPTEAVATTDAAPVLVDALFGTGLRRALAPEIVSALTRLSNPADIVIAADLPSGVGADDGADLGAVAADLTIAFGAAKPGHLLQPGAALCGSVLRADIGIDVRSIANVLSPPATATPTAEDHKYTRGFVVVIGGTMPGAAALAAIASLRSGAGYVAGVGLPREGLPHAIVHRDLAMLDDPRVGAVVIGPGLGNSREGRAALGRALAGSCPLVIDGDALGLVDPVSVRRAGLTILTPHAGEFDRLFGQSGGSKIDRARAAASVGNAIVVLKGADTVIAAPDGRVALSLPASPWLSTAGSGDVLAGIIGSMLAQGRDAFEAACAAVWIHGEAARRAGPRLIADDLLDHLAQSW